MTHQTQEGVEKVRAPHPQGAIQLPNCHKRKDLGNYQPGGSIREENAILHLSVQAARCSRIVGSSNGPQRQGRSNISWQVC
jgi:hypothetical protein